MCTFLRDLRALLVLSVTRSLVTAGAEAVAQRSSRLEAAVRALASAQA